MANFKLGRVEAARLLLQQLRDLPTKGFPNGEVDYANWLREAEALIEGPAPASQPVTTAPAAAPQP